MPGHPDDVTPLKVPVDKIELLFPEIVFPYIQLDTAALISKVCEYCFPMVPDRKNPSGSCDTFLALFVFYCMEPLLDLFDSIFSFKFRRVQRHSGLLYCPDLVKSRLVKVEGFWCQTHLVTHLPLVLGNSVVHPHQTENKWFTVFENGNSHGTVHYVRNRATSTGGIWSEMYLLNSSSRIIIPSMRDLLPENSGRTPREIEGKTNNRFSRSSSS